MYIESAEQPHWTKLTYYLSSDSVIYSQSSVFSPPKICANITCISSSSLPAALHLPLHCADVEEEEGSLQLIQALNTDCCVHQRKFYFRTSTQNFCLSPHTEPLIRRRTRKTDFFLFIYFIVRSSEEGAEEEMRSTDGDVLVRAKTLNLLLCYRCWVMHASF